MRCQSLWCFVRTYLPRITRTTCTQIKKLLVVLRKSELFPLFPNFVFKSPKQIEIKQLSSLIIVDLVIFSSPLHCTSKCISTPGCSAFQYYKDSGSCTLGSKINLQIAQQGDLQEELTEISINEDGKKICISKKSN